ncbi:MAG: hypothetical protein AAB425_11735, partial [Bdellovibrionota bacterium]
AGKNPNFFSLFLFFYHLSACQKEFRHLQTGIRETGRQRILTILYEGVTKGDFKRPSADGLGLELLAFQIQALITGSVIQCFTESGCNPKLKAQETSRLILKWLT